MMSSNALDACVICTTPIVSQVVGVLPCSHTFCFECIQAWAGNSNTCPLCKERFLHIEQRGGGSRARRVKVAEAELEASYGPEEYAEEFYGEAQDYVENAAAAGAAYDAPVIQFVGFGMNNYRSSEDEDFSASGSVQIDIADDEEDEDDDEKADDDEEEEEDHELEDDEDEDEYVGAGEDPLASVWGSRRRGRRDVYEPPSSSSATPVRPRRSQRVRASRRDEYDDDEEDDEEEYEEEKRPRRSTRSSRTSEPYGYDFGEYFNEEEDEDFDEASPVMAPPPPPRRSTRRRQTLDLVTPPPPSRRRRRGATAPNTIDLLSDSDTPRRSRRISRNNNNNSDVDEDSLFTPN